MAKKEDLCRHGKYGTICHKCFPEMHTYLALFGETKNMATFKRYTASSWHNAMDKGKRLGATEIFHRMFAVPPVTHKPDPSLTDTETA